MSAPVVGGFRSRQRDRVAYGLAGAPTDVARCLTGADLLLAAVMLRAPAALA